MNRRIVHDVAVAGPTGRLGPATIKHLLAAGFKVTALTRGDPETAQLPDGVKAVKADYSSAEALAPSLEGGNFDALVVLLNRQTIEEQLACLGAAVRARIPRVVPSCFAIPLDDKEVRTSPFFAGKVRVEDDLLVKAREGRITYTGINIGLLLDWALDAGVLVNLTGQGGRPTTILDGGDARTSATFSDDVGKAIATALGDYTGTANRFLNIQSTTISQNQLLGYAKEAAAAAGSGKEFPTVDVDTAELEKAAWEAHRKGDHSPMAQMGFIARLDFGLGKALLKTLDNEELGIRECGEERLRSEVARRVNQA